MLYERFRSLLRPRRDFRGLLTWGVAGTIFVLVVNLVLLIVSTQLATTATGAKLLFSGDCNYASSRSTVAHLAINVLATLVLGASNAAMQCLSAPTRDDIDRAHKRGIWLDVGVSSLRSLFRGDWFRLAAWFGLLLTSVPLHLVYNSVFLQSTQANAYNTLIVSQDFLGGAWSDLKDASYPGGDRYWGIPSNISKQIQSEVHTYTKLSWDECRSAYGVPLVKDWANLVIITNVNSIKDSPTNSSVMTSFWYTPSVSDIASNLFLSSGDDVNFASYGSDQGIMLQLDGNVLSNFLWYTPDNPNPAVEMLYCLAQPMTTVCTIELFQPFLETVIVANVLKVLCFMWILYGLPSLTPLITFGDAVASFLARPDPLTAGGRAVDRDWLERNEIKVEYDARSMGTLYREKVVARDRWVKPSIRWIRAPSTGQRAVTFFVCLALVVFGGVITYLGNQSLQPEWFPDPNPIPNLNDIWSNGLGNVYPQEVFAATLTWSIGGSLLAANAPQLVMSILYLIFNQYVTLMCVSAEAQSFCVTRQYLRVSRPRGQQRSSYWLGLPFVYGIPLLIACTALHWALSQSLFIAEINILTPNQQSVSTPNINAVGYSIVGSIIVVGLGGLMIVALLVVGFSRVFPSGMPLLSSNSVAISAACHGHYSSDNPNESPETHHGREAEAAAPLMYGVTEITAGDKRGRVGFSSEEVQPLEVLWIYGRPEKKPVSVPEVEPKVSTEVSSLLGRGDNLGDDGSRGANPLDREAVPPHIAEAGSDVRALQIGQHPRRTSRDRLMRDYSQLDV